MKHKIILGVMIESQNIGANVAEKFLNFYLDIKWCLFGVVVQLDKNIRIMDQQLSLP